jgi:hypothetical protein
MRRSLPMSADAVLAGNLRPLEGRRLPDSLTTKGQTMNHKNDLDIEQVLDLIFNGFTREGACAAVAESHGHDPWGAYTEALLAHPDVQAADDGLRPA